MYRSIEFWALVGSTKIPWSDYVYFNFNISTTDQAALFVLRWFCFSFLSIYTCDYDNFLFIYTLWRFSRALKLEKEKKNLFWFNWNRETMRYSRQHFSHSGKWRKHFSYHDEDDTRRENDFYGSRLWRTLGLWMHSLSTRHSRRCRSLCLYQVRDLGVEAFIWPAVLIVAKYDRRKLWNQRRRHEFCQVCHSNFTLTRRFRKKGSRDGEGVLGERLSNHQVACQVATDETVLPVYGPASDSVDGGSFLPSFSPIMFSFSWTIVLSHLSLLINAIFFLPRCIIPTFHQWIHQLCLSSCLSNYPL